MTQHVTSWKQENEQTKLTKEEGKQKQIYVRKMTHRKRKIDRGRRREGKTMGN
jgi:hypothetical protein